VNSAPPDYDAIRVHLSADPVRSGLFLDFDGTLMPFAGPVQNIVLTDELLGNLRHLSEKLATVAIVSGRPLAFLLRTFPIRGIRLAGVYGLEEWVEGRRQEAPGVAPWLPVIRKTVDELRRTTSELKGVQVRDKNVSVIVHWPGDANSAVGARINEITHEVATRTGLRRQSGKSAEELLPPVPVDKGIVVRRICQEKALTTGLYVGDDLSDIPAFEAVHELGGIAVAVDEQGRVPQPGLEALTKHADFVLAGPAEVHRLLATLCDTLSL
jgi:trehalose 6-phosphate phosphatase